MKFLLTLPTLQPRLRPVGESLLISLELNHTGGLVSACSKDWTVAAGSRLVSACLEDWSAAAESNLIFAIGLNFCQSRSKLLPKKLLLNRSASPIF